MSALLPPPPPSPACTVLIGLTEDQRMSMPELADMMLERTRNGNWVVVFKALISTHNLMVLGNEVRRGGAEGRGGEVYMWVDSEQS